MYLGDMSTKRLESLSNSISIQIATADKKGQTKLAAKLRQQFNKVNDELDCRFSNRHNVTPGVIKERTVRTIR